jgi:hypothetical protein
MMSAQVLLLELYEAGLAYTIAPDSEVKGDLGVNCYDQIQVEQLPGGSLLVLLTKAGRLTKLFYKGSYRALVSEGEAWPTNEEHYGSAASSAGASITEE